MNVYAVQLFYPSNWSVFLLFILVLSLRSTHSTVHCTRVVSEFGEQVFKQQLRWISPQ